MSSTLAMLLVLLLGSAMAVVTRADDVCRVTMSHEAEGPQVAVTGLLECAAGQRGTYQPLADSLVVFTVFRAPGRRVVYGEVTCAATGPAAATPASTKRSAATPLAHGHGGVVVNPCGLPDRTPTAGRKNKADTDIDLVYARTGRDGKATFTFKRPAGAGSIKVYAVPFAFSGLGQLEVVQHAEPRDTAVPRDAVGRRDSVVRRDAPPPTGTRLVLMPQKAVREPGQPFKITARLLDADEQPVAGADVTFGITGTCGSTLTSKVSVTNADGYATLSLFGAEPCVMAVVAAAAGPDNMPLISPPSNITIEDSDYAADSDSKKPKDDATKHNKYGDAARAQVLAKVQAKPS